MLKMTVQQTFLMGSNFMVSTLLLINASTKATIENKWQKKEKLANNLRVKQVWIWKSPNWNLRVELLIFEFSLFMKIDCIFHCI